MKRGQVNLAMAANPGIAKARSSVRKGVCLQWTGFVLAIRATFFETNIGIDRENK